MLECNFEDDSRRSEQGYLHPISYLSEIQIGLTLNVIKVAALSSNATVNSEVRRWYLGECALVSRVLWRIYSCCEHLALNSSSGSCWNIVLNLTCPWSRQTNHPPSRIPWLDSILYSYSCILGNMILGDHLCRKSQSFYRFTSAIDLFKTSFNRVLRLSMSILNVLQCAIL